MNHFFEDVKIKNFKSLREVALNNCSRINILIGRPNVGKSNILEALSLFMVKGGSLESFLQHSMRFDSENSIEFFFNGEDEKKVEIESNLESFNIHLTAENVLKLEELNDSASMKYQSEVKKYAFRRSENMNLKAWSSNKSTVLASPFGENLFNILQNNQPLRKECQKLFEPYRLQFLFDKSNKTLRIAKKASHNEDDLPAIFTVPYGAIADTLQRVIFYKTAIASNEGNVLLFEEPESHAFPPYIAHITQEIIAATTNQFFITTHSPFIVSDFMENAREELSIYVVDWQNDETVVKKMTTEQVYDAYQYGIDLFFNLENYV